MQLRLRPLEAPQRERTARERTARDARRRGAAESRGEHAARERDARLAEPLAEFGGCTHAIELRGAHGAVARVAVVSVEQLGPLEAAAVPAALARLAARGRRDRRVAPAPCRGEPPAEAQHKRVCRGGRKVVAEAQAALGHPLALKVQEDAVAVEDAVRQHVVRDGAWRAEAARRGPAGQEAPDRANSLGEQQPRHPRRGHGGARAGGEGVEEEDARAALGCGAEEELHVGRGARPRPPLVPDVLRREEGDVDRSGGGVDHLCGKHRGWGGTGVGRRLVSQGRAGVSRKRSRAVSEGSRKDRSPTGRRLPSP
mmetsp:Transcript_41421/g.137739  ORF Transcript_41421/g.137739 Transcript_41421/m.137739 type:complete len:312 (-) Transcript_41421:924-1859(-)